MTSVYHSLNSSLKLGIESFFFFKLQSFIIESVQLGRLTLLKALTYKQSLISVADTPFMVGLQVPTAVVAFISPRRNTCNVYHSVKQIMICFHIMDGERRKAFHSLFEFLTQWRSREFRLWTTKSIKISNSHYST